MKIMNTADGVDTLGTNQDAESLKNTEKGFCISQDIQIPQTVESSENHAGVVYYPNLTLLLDRVTQKHSDMCSVSKLRSISYT